MPKRSRKSKTLKQLKKEAWRLMSIWIRSKDADSNGYVDCYTCDARMHWRMMNASHFWHGRLDFDERNLKNCCVTCNKWKHGNLGVYAARLIEENGQEWFNQLKRDAQVIHKIPAAEYEKIINDLNVRLKTKS